MPNKELMLTVGCVALATASVFGGLQLNRAIKLKKAKGTPFALPDGFTYTAHTGCTGTKANSLESIEAAVKYGADIVEFDLRFAEDGTPVLSHDEPVGGEIPLEEAFKKISEYENLRVNVDVKCTTNLAEVEALARKHGIFERIFYTGIRDFDVEAVLKDSPAVPYFLNVDVKKKQDEAYLDSLVKKVKDCGAIGINFNKKSATKKLVDTFRENGLLVSIWTANSEKDIYRVLTLAPDNITTKQPDIIKKILQDRTV